MSVPYSGKYEVIAKKRRNRIIYGLISSAIGLVITYLYNTNSLNIIPISLRDFLLILSLLILSVGITMLINPISNYESFIFNIIKSIELYNKASGEKEIVKDAQTKLLNGISNLRLVKFGSLQIYDDVKKEEKRFLRNLKRRVAPAMLNYDVTDILTESLGVLLEGDIKDLYQINGRIEINYEDASIDRFDYKTLINDLYDNKLIKIVVSFIIGFSLPFLLILVVGTLLGINVYEYITFNLIEIVTVCLATSYATLNWFLKKDWI